MAAAKVSPSKPESAIAKLLNNSTSPEPPVRVLDLISQFEAALAHKDSINETTLRETYLNPLLEELGWDPRNRRGLPALERDVILEDSLLIGGASKAPDYAFVVDQKRKFFVEAKRPSVKIASAKSGAYQLRRYCWSATLPFGLLTDFEEFAVYDCRAMPDANDGPEVARVAYFTVRELPKYWPLLSGLFGKSSVVAGRLDEVAAGSKQPTNARPIDGAFLAEIRSWREHLAKVVAEDNPLLEVVQINQVVQTLIDRMIFLRIAEARGLEPVDELMTIASDEPGVYARLLGLFYRADDRYNSGLFHLCEKTHVQGRVDKIAPHLKVPDFTLRWIIKRTYYPEPYEFSVLPADLLGRIYEQFLGERIAVDEKRRVNIEVKPEVRKAGGVYYTPAPIVEYIVHKTVGPLLAGRRPQDVVDLKILDPACGSGSFLIAAFQYLIDWHREYYADKPRLAKQYLEAGSDGLLRLKTAERKRILLNNVYGIDIDPQAVEVTKLSLLLKVIEGQHQMELAIGRILPDIDGNILCGNSLIAPDFPMPIGLTEEEALQYNPFDWKAAWPGIMKTGGFDAVIGNPPYLQLDAVWGKNDPRTRYIKAHYKAVYQDKTDILFYFVKKGADVCKGEIAFIVSRSFLEADKAQNLREWLGGNVRIREVLDFRHAAVFPKVGINTAIIRLTHSKAPKVSSFRRWTEPALPPGYTAKTLEDPSRTKRVEVPVGKLGRKSWNFGDLDVETLLAKLDAAGAAVGDLLHVGQGMQTGANAAFILDIGRPEYEKLHKLGFAYERARNSDIWPYVIASSGIYLMFPNAASKFASLPVELQRCLKANQDRLKQRAAFLRGNCEWWQYTWPLHQQYLSRRRIMCPYRASTNRFALDRQRSFLGITDTTILYDGDQPEDLLYVLGVLNSAVATFRFHFIGKLLGGGVYEYYENTVSKLPIPRRRPGNPEHDYLVDLVARRIEADEELCSTVVKGEQDVMQAVIEKLDLAIDEHVAGLFGLTANEINVISEALASPS